MEIAIIGAGYVGLVSGACLAGFGHQVVCLDNDPNKVAQLQTGRVPFYEPGLAELVQENLRQGKIFFTDSLAVGLANASFIFICVGTPPLFNGQADLSFVEQAAYAIGNHIAHNAYVITKSTVPVGTARLVKKLVDQGIKDSGRDARLVNVVVASNPEFLREGSAVSDFCQPDRVVVGVDERWAGDLIMELYQPLECPKLIMSPESAELTKYAANAFLATKISFINEIADLAEKTGADIREVAKAVGLDKRIGSSFLKAGIGYGGSCFPKDVAALRQWAGQTGHNFHLLSSVIEINNYQRERFVNKVRAVIGELNGKRLAVWGLAFKAGTDDLRESAAVDIINRCFAEGADIVAYDPQVKINAQRIFADRIELVGSALDAVRHADALLVLTEWPEFRALPMARVREVMHRAVIFDGRNLLSDMSLFEQGFAYYGMGFGH